MQTIKLRRGLDIPFEGQAVAYTPAVFAYPPHSAIRRHRGLGDFPHMQIKNDISRFSSLLSLVYVRFFLYLCSGFWAICL